MKKLVLFLILPLAASAQTLSVTNTVAMSNVAPPGYNIGLDAPFGPSQKLASLMYTNFGYLPALYTQMALPCSQGGTQTTTNWFNNTVDARGYAASYFVGAQYTAASQTGVLLGTGTVTAQTTNQTGSGWNFTLSPALSSACTAGSNIAASDVIQIRLRTTPSGFTTPADVFPFLTGTETWNTSDTDPAGTNSQWSLQLVGGAVTNFLDESVPQTQNTVSTSQVVYRNINGSYTEKHDVKCLTSGCTIAYSFGREFGSTMLSGTDSPTFNVTPGAGWQTFTHTFAGSETGSQTAPLNYILTCTGTCLIQSMDVIEGSTLAGNTTHFRDAYFQWLQRSNPGTLRYMDVNDWCSDAEHMTAQLGGEGACTLSPFQRASYGPAIPYEYILEACNALPAVKRCQITMGHFNTPSDYVYMAQFVGDPGCTSAGGAARCAWGQTASWNSVFAAKGAEIDLADGNEAWNTNASGSQESGNGIAYGLLDGPKVHAFKTATGFYNSTVDKFIANGEAGGTQSYGIFGFTQNVFVTSTCNKTTNPTFCPDYAEMAPYLEGNLNTLTSAVAGATLYTDEMAEVTNNTSVSGNPTSGGFVSIPQTQAYINSNWGANVSIYESSYGTAGGGTSPTQAFMNQNSSGVGEGMNVYEQSLSAVQDGGVVGPISMFASADQPFNGSINGTQQSSWSAIHYLAAGPGQISTWTDVDRPVAIFHKVGNTAIGTKTNLMTATLASGPTLNYPGGQSGDIAANTAVPYIKTHVYSDGAGNWAILVFNRNEQATEPITFSFASGTAPVGNITETIVGGPVNGVNDNNANTNINNNATPAPVVIPSPTTLSSLTTLTLPAASMTALTFSSNGTGTVATPTFSPIAGTYGSAQTVTITTSTSGATICYTTDGSTPLAATAGTCSHGTTYSTPVSVPSSLTINAIGTLVGDTNSSVGTAAYVISAATSAVKISGKVTVSGKVVIQ